MSVYILLHIIGIIARNHCSARAEADAVYAALNNPGFRSALGGNKTQTAEIGVEHLRIAFVAYIFRYIDFTVEQRARLHIFNRLLHSVNGFYIEILHKLPVYAARVFLADEVVERSREKGGENAAVHTEGVNAAVLMKHGNIYAV